MPRLTQLHSFLDQFEERLEIDCEQLKRQLVAQVDQQFRVVREKVNELRILIGVNRVLTTRRVILIDGPPVETVQLDQWKQEQRALVDSSGRDVPSTSTGRKRKSSTTSGINRNKRPKTATTDGSNKFLCKSPGCGKSFRDAHDLTRHERIHLGIKPFSCIWLDCRYSAVLKGELVKHVRFHHFKLHKFKKEQTRLNIVDSRNPEDYVRVDNQLLEIRLE